MSFTQKIKEEVKEFQQKDRERLCLEYALYEREMEEVQKALEEVEEEIFNSCIDSGVLVARGSWFLAEKDKPLPGLYFRTTYAMATPDAMNEAIKRFGKAVRDSFGKK